MLHTLLVPLFLLFQDEALHEELLLRVQQAIDAFVEPEDSIQLPPQSYWNETKLVLDRAFRFKASREMEARYLFITGMASLMGGQLEEAISDFRRSLNLDPNDASLSHYGLGLAYSFLKDYSMAEPEFRQAADLQPDWFRPQAALAALYMEHGRYREAEQAIRKSLESTKSERPKGRQYLLLAQVLHSQGSSEEVEVALQKGVDVDSSDALLYEYLGVLLLQQNRPDEAIAAWRKGSEVSPRYTPIQRNLALAERGLRVSKSERLKGPLRSQLRRSDPRLPDGSRFRAYMIKGKVGEVLKVRADSPDFTTFVALVSSEGKLVAAHDLRSTYFSALEYKFPDTATYHLIVSSYNPDQFGTFELK